MQGRTEWKCGLQSRFAELWRRVAGWKSHIATQVVGQVVRPRSPQVSRNKPHRQRTQHAHRAVIGNQVIQQIVQPDRFRMKIRVHHGLVTGMTPALLEVGFGCNES